MGVLRQNKRLLYVLQQVCYAFLLMLLLVSLNGLSAHTVTAVRRKACNTFNSRNRSQTCECSSVNVRCVKINPPLTAVPTGIFERAMHLDLSGNAIQRIEENDFTGLEFIQKMYLQDNLISYIHPNAFRNMYKLEVLNLENNRLGEVDPSGHTFQHLSSLLTLSLQNSSITKVNKYSFLTMIASGNTVSVNLNQNSIHCDCDVWALRSWARSLSVCNIEIRNLTCINDQHRRTYQEVEDSVFGFCNYSSWEDGSEADTFKKETQIREKDFYERNSLMKENDLGEQTNDKYMEMMMVVKKYAYKIVSTNENSNQVNGMRKSTSQAMEKGYINAGVSIETDVTTEQKDGSNRKEEEEMQSKYKKHKVHSKIEKNNYEDQRRNVKDMNQGQSEHKRDIDQWQDRSEKNKFQSTNKRKTAKKQIKREAKQDKQDQGKEENTSDTTDNGNNEHEQRQSDVTHDSVFGQKTTCPRCQNERTNHGCMLNRPIQCSGEQMVCHRTVEWSVLDHAMTISSKCETYTSCLAQEANNKEKCGIGFQSNGSVNCHFCCQGPTCTNSSIGGRTKDFTFSLSYIRSNASYQPFMDDSGNPQYLDEEQRIDIGIRGAISSLKGGLDVYLLRFVLLDNRQYRTLLRLEVTTFSTETEETVEKDIKDDILFSIQDPNSFFHGENIIPDSLTVSSNNGGSDQCPESVSYSLDKGNITWNAANVGLILELPCPFNSLLGPALSYASRTCLKAADGSAKWGEVDYSSCASKSDQENPVSEEIFDTLVTPGNAQAVSESLKTYIVTLNNFTVDSVNKVVNRLEELLNETILQRPDVVQNIVGCVSSLINIDQKTLQELETKTSISQRLLAVLDYISEKAPLVDGKLMLVTPNLVIAAQGINASETQDVTLTANTDSIGGLNDSMVSVGFSSRNVSKLSSRISMVIPTQAVVASSTPGEKINMNRVSFAIHLSDKLFIVIKKTEVNGTPEENNTQNYVCEKNNSSECPREKPQTYVTKINSLVIAASVPGVIVQDLSENITMSFIHKDANATNPRCVFWNKYLSNGTGGWSDEGCGIVKSYLGETTCGCNHLTNFALLMDVYQGGSNLSDLDRKILSIISYVGCGISLFALLLTLLTYSFFRKLRRDNPSKILINLCLALLLSNLVFLVGMHNYTFDNTASCKAVAVLLHYFLLSSLSWMAVEAFYMYLALVLVFKTYFTNFILKCSLVGWGVPLAIVVITLGVNTTENYGFLNSGLCWLRNPAFYAAFVGPVCFILLINCLAFGLVVRQLLNVSSTKLNKTDRNSTIQRLRGAVGVVILLGLTWLFAIFAIGQASVAFYYLFAVFNSLQGLFICIFYCVLKNDALTAWKRSLPCFEEYGETSKSSSNSRAMTATGATHHLVRHNSHSRSGSSTYTGTTASTLINSRKSSYFSNVISNNPYDSNEEYDAPINIETGAADAANCTQKSSPLLSPEHQDSPKPETDQLPSYTSSEYDNLAKDYVNTVEDSQTENKYIDTTPECTDSNYSKFQSEVPGDVHDSKFTLTKDSLLTKTEAASLEPSETLNCDSMQLASPESKHSPSAKGEIDYSCQGKVNDIKVKFERSNSGATDINVTHL